MRAVVIANGKVQLGQCVQKAIAAADLVVAADGGVTNALALGLRPGVVVGDFDSLSSGLLAELEQGGVKLLRHPMRKNETDAELALRYCVEWGAGEIAFLGALGGRLDHALANLFLLASPELAAVKARIVDGNVTLMLCRDRCVVQGQPGDLVSLLPLKGDAFGVHTENLEYPLHGETLRFGPARGVSNVMLAHQAAISLETGLLAVIHIAANKKEERAHE